MIVYSSVFVPDITDRINQTLPHARLWRDRGVIKEDHRSNSSGIHEQIVVDVASKFWKYRESLQQLGDSLLNRLFLTGSSGTVEHLNFGITTYLDDWVIYYKVNQRHVVCMLPWPRECLLHIDGEDGLSHPRTTPRHFPHTLHIHPVLQLHQRKLIPIPYFSSVRPNDDIRIGCFFWWVVLLSQTHKLNVASSFVLWGKFAEHWNYILVAGVADSLRGKGYRAVAWTGWD